MSDIHVRDARPVDFPAILTMLRRGRENAPLSFLRQADDAAHITQHLTNLFAGRGLILVTESSASLTGYLLASIDPTFWNPKAILMTATAYWVEPEFRHGVSAHRLITEYCARGNAMKAKGRIDHFVIGKTTQSPDMSFDKFGFTKMEEFWVN